MRLQPPMPFRDKMARHPIWRRFFRFLSWWLVFAGIYASSSVCPFCGRPGCPVGGVSAGVAGGIFALVMEKGKAVGTFLAGRISLLRCKLTAGTKVWPGNARGKSQRSEMKP